MECERDRRGKEPTPRGGVASIGAGSCANLGQDNVAERNQGTILDIGGLQQGPGMARLLNELPARLHHPPPGQSDS